MHRSLFIHFVRTTKQFKKLLRTGPSNFASSKNKIKMNGFNDKDIQPVTLKLESEELKSIYTPELNSLVEIFKRHGFEIRIAGGAVRDLLMGKVPNDLDFATTATPDEMKEIFTKENVRMINAKGEKHGTITPRINDKENFEVTTLRIDVTTDGRHAEVLFTKNWQLDANRRDLTINCLFMDLDGIIYDYFNGIEDIKNRRVLFVGDADARIKEDFLRILRYFRFYGRIANEPNNHDPKVLEAICNNAQGLANISGERIWTELKKILEGNFAGELIESMINCGLRKYIGLPDDTELDRFQLAWSHLKGSKYHGVTLMSSLIDTSEEAWELQGRLKMSAYERDLLMYLIEHRDEEPISVDPLMPYQKAVAISKSKTTDAKQWTVELLKLSGKHKLAEELHKWVLPRFPINGNMAREKGCPSGKMLGTILYRLKMKWAESSFTMTPNEILDLIPSIVDELNASPHHSPQKIKKTKASGDVL